MQTNFRSKTMANNDRQQQLNKNNLPTCHFVSSRVLGSCLLLSASLFVATPSFAEEQQYTVASGDTLIRIVRKEYPSIKDRQSQRTIMREIVKQNSNSFINEDVNGIKLGATLTLPSLETIEGLQKSSSEAEQEAPTVSAASDDAEQTETATDVAEAEEDEAQEPASDTKPDEKVESTETSDNDAVVSAQAASEDNVASSEADDALDSEKKRLESALADAEEKIKQLNGDLEAVKSSDAKQASEALAASKAKASDLSKKLDALEAQNEALTEKLTDIESKYANLQSETSEQASNKAADEQANAENDEQLDALKTSLSQEQAKNKDLQDKIKQYEADIEIVNAKLADLQKQSADAAIKPEASASDDIEALNAQVEQLTSLAEKYEKENEELKQQLAGSANAATGEGATAGSDSEQIEALQTQLEQITALAEKYEVELDELKAQGMSGAVSQTAEPEADSAALASLQSDLEKKDQRITSLEGQVEDFSSENVELSKRIKELEASSGSGIGWLAWLLPIIGLLGGSYWISSRLRKRADEEAAAELRSVMNSAEAAVERSLTPAEGESSVATTAATTEQDEDDFEADIKLDIAKAYFELNNEEAAHDILQEVLREGSTNQRTKAEKLLENIQ